MREIKFRAWDKPSGKWIYLRINNGHLNHISCTSWFAEKHAIQGRHLTPWMQYTGLKDNNGNGQEIYEGDIIKGGVKPSIVKFGILEENFDDEMDNANGFYIENVYTENKKSLTSGNCEIIGNIWEQPNLLDKT